MDSSPSRRSLDRQGQLDESRIRRRSSCQRLPVTMPSSIEHAGDSAARVRVAGENVLVVSGPLHDDRAIAAGLRSWLAELAQQCRSAMSSPKLRPKAISVTSRTQIRRQRTRWGSCSATGTISLNVCLLFLRPQVVRYLLLQRAMPHAAHESLGEILGAGRRASSLNTARSTRSCCAAGRACRDGCSRERAGSPSAIARPVDLSDEQVHWDLGESQSYGQYLGLDQLLSVQKPVSVEHDEMLFIIIHQASELWMKLCLHELTAARDHISSRRSGPVVSRCWRASRASRRSSCSHGTCSPR